MRQLLRIQKILILSDIPQGLRGGERCHENKQRPTPVGIKIVQIIRSKKYLFYKFMSDH